MATLAPTGRRGADATVLLQLYRHPGPIHRRPHHAGARSTRPVTASPFGGYSASRPSEGACRQRQPKTTSQGGLRQPTRIENRSNLNLSESRNCASPQSARFGKRRSLHLTNLPSRGARSWRTQGDAFERPVEEWLLIEWPENVTEPNRAGGSNAIIGTSIRNMPRSLGGTRMAWVAPPRRALHRGVRLPLRRTGGVSPSGRRNQGRPGVGDVSAGRRSTNATTTA